MAEPLISLQGTGEATLVGGRAPGGRAARRGADDRIRSEHTGYALETHPPTTFVPLAAGVFLMAVAIAGVAVTRYERAADATLSAGLDLSRVTEHGGALATTVAQCEIRVLNRGALACQA